jgi:methylmalonic acid semialdehyde dehydrogenase
MLQNKKPEPIITPGARTPAEWVEAGRQVFRELDFIHSRSYDPKHIAIVRSAEEYAKLGGHAQPDGTVAFLRWVPTSKGLALSVAECAGCHVRTMPDGSRQDGPPVNDTGDVLIGELAAAGDVRFFGEDVPGMVSWRSFAAPWVADDIHAGLQTMPQDELDGLLSPNVQILGTFPLLTTGTHDRTLRIMAQELTHFIGGKKVKGTSDRFGNVFGPMTGEVAARVPLASAAEVDAAVQNARTAQPAWAAINPQRRARVMAKFVDLLNRDMDKLADVLAREHGKTVPDAKGDIQRGLEVCEFATGIPHLLKGEYTDGAGPGIDIYSIRQPLGVVAGITPFNFPAMIPMWKFAPAIACGNAFILKPSERDPGVPLMLAELMIEAGLPAGILNVVNGDKEAVDAILDHPQIEAVGFVGSTPIAAYVYARGTASGKRVQCFGGAKNHMLIMPDADLDQAVDALIGAGYGSAGERCMAVSVAVPVGKQTADALMEKLIPRVEGLKIGPSTSQEADFGPVVTAAHLQKVKDYVDIGI